MFRDPGTGAGDNIIPAFWTPPNSPLPVAAFALDWHSFSTLNIYEAVENIISNASKIILINFLSVADNI